MSIKANNNPNHIYKIVIAGSVGSGKTQATSVLSENEVVFTEASTSEPTSSDKKTITVAMDYGVMSLDSGEKVHLYGTLGHKRFDFV